MSDNEKMESMDDYLDELEQEVLRTCSKYSDSCEIRYSACSRHPDYRVD